MKPTNTRSLTRIFFNSFFIFLLASNALIGQESCLSEEYKLMAWFKTDADENAIAPTGEWNDYGKDNIKLYKIPIGDDALCNNPQPYSNQVLSMNYNPALIFSSESDNFEFRLKNNRKQDVTIFAVLVPRDRNNPESEEFAVSYSNKDRARSLDIDKIRINSSSIDYGENYGTDLKVSESEGTEEGPGSYEYEKYGKIVSYTTVLNADRCTSASSLMSQIYNIYSKNGERAKQTGQVPEFLVFQGLMDNANRHKVESYLAIKYGISKEKNYVGCNGAIVWDHDKGLEYNYRKTGIGNDIGFDLNQSRSTTYYEEKDFMWHGRLDPDHYYNTVQDFSHHRSRLLTIGIEDEISTIQDRWASGYRVWGDNNEDLTIIQSNNNPKLKYINRVWRMEAHDNNEGNDKTASIRWCNAIDIKNDSPNETLSDLGMAFPGSGRVGVCASSTPILKSGSLSFRVENINDGNGSMIGFSGDNMEFVNATGSVSNYKGYIFALRFTGGLAQVVYDQNGDGEYDVMSAINATNGNYELTYKRNSDGENEFSVNGNDFIIHHKCIGSRGVFAKVHIMGNTLRFLDIYGKGFKESNSKGTNVEYSIDRIGEEGLPVLIIDRGAAGNTMDADGGEMIRGSYSKTPGGYSDKIEFVNVQWDSDGNGLDYFTLGFLDCDNEEVVVSTDGCCKELTDVSISIKTCLPSDEVYYELINTDDDVIVISNSSTAGDVALGSLEPGNYELSVYFPGCNTVVNTFELVSTLIPENIILEECYLLGECVPVADLPPNTILEIYSPNGTAINVTNDQCVDANQTGIYTLGAALICEDVVCKNSDSFEVTTLDVKSGFEQCCNCGYLTMEAVSTCFTGESAEYTINYGNQTIQGDIIINGPPVTLQQCFGTGNGTIDIEYRGITSTTQISNTLEPLPSLNLPETVEISQLGESYCLNYDDLISSLGSFAPSNAIFYIYDDNNNQINRIHEYNQTVCLSETGCYTISIELSCPQETCTISDEICINNPCGEFTLDIGCDGIEDVQPFILTDSLIFCIDGPGCAKQQVIVTLSNGVDTYQLPPSYFTASPFEFSLEGIPPGEYSLSILFNCAGCTGFKNIPVIVTEPCGDVYVNTKCADKKICLENLPSDCIPFSFTIYENGSPIFQGQSDESGNIELSLPSGNYTLTIDGGPGCTCTDVVIPFTINTLQLQALEGYYCGGETVEINNVNICSDSSRCIVWEKIGVQQNLVIQEGIISNNCTFSASSEPGNYMASIYDCATEQLIGRDFFTIYGNCLPLSSRIDMEEVGCSDKGTVIQMNYKESVEVERYIRYELLQHLQDNLYRQVKTGLLVKGDTVYITDIPGGDYVLITETDAGYKSNTTLTVSDLQRLPSRLLEKDRFVLDERGNVSLDASKNVLYNAIYEWSKDNIVLSTLPGIVITDIGSYKVKVTTADCEKTEEFEVVNRVGERYSETQNSNGIELLFRNLSFEHTQQEITIINHKIEDNTKLEVFTIDGKIVFSDIFTDIKRETAIIKLKGGVYIIKARNSSGYQINKKIIIAH